MKKLPKIYRSKELTPKDHNQKSYILENKKIGKSIEEELDSLFNSFSNLYNKKVKIVTKNKTYDTYLVSRTKNYVMTTNKEIISIKDIIELKRSSA